MTDAAPTPWAKPLLEMREALGASVLEVARETGLSKATVSRLESGATKDPGIQVLMCIARHYGYSVGALLDGSKFADRGDLEADRDGALMTARAWERKWKTTDAAFDAMSILRDDVAQKYDALLTSWAELKADRDRISAELDAERGR